MDFGMETDIFEHALEVPWHGAPLPFAVSAAVFGLLGLDDLEDLEVGQDGRLAFHDLRGKFVNDMEAEIGHKMIGTFMLKVI